MDAETVEAARKKLIRSIVTHAHGERGQCAPEDCETCLNAIAAHTEAALKEHLDNCADSILGGNLRDQLAAAEGERAKHEHCIEQVQADQLKTAERENELHAEKDAEIATLQAALAQARAALEAIAMRTDGPSFHLDGDIRGIINEALSASDAHPDGLKPDGSPCEWFR